MIQAITQIIKDATMHLSSKMKMRCMLKATFHFQERYIQRFTDEDIPQLERTIEKAIEKIATFGKPVKYTHPAYGITVVVTKQGLNCAELVTYWKKEEDAE